MEFRPSELILNERGSVYHLDLLPNEVADRIVLVGDPQRVDAVAKHFDSVDFERHQREFITKTGFIGEKRVTVVSTGIGTDNIDIVLNELNILASIDLTTRTPLETARKLRFVRVGTCGILQENIPVGAFIMSRFSIGFDALMHFYKTEESYDVYHLKAILVDYFKDKGLDMPFYLTEAVGEFKLDVPEKHIGITATLPGFYGPQGREITIPSKFPDLLSNLSEFAQDELKVINFEMESSGLFGLAGLMGHESCTICLGLANRITGEFIKDPAPRMEKLIEDVLEAI